MIRRLPGGNRVPYLHADFLFGEAKLIRLLKVQPELGPGAEPRSEPQRGVGSDAALAGKDLCHAIGGNVQLPAQLSGAHLELGEFVGKNFTGMDRRSNHGPVSLNGSQRSRCCSVPVGRRATRSKSSSDR